MESKHVEHKTHQFSIPTSVVSVADVGKLIREIDTIQNNLMQLKVRDPGTPIAMPVISKRMEQLLEMNKLNLLKEEDRQRATEELTKIRDNAPVFHVSFSSDPTPAFLEKLMVWIRKEISPSVLLTIGLQPSIGAGCMLRTTNKYFDMSLKQTFLEKRPLLLEQIIPAEQLVEVPQA